MVAGNGHRKWTQVSNVVKNSYQMPFFFCIVAPSYPGGASQQIPFFKLF